MSIPGVVEEHDYMIGLSAAETSSSPLERRSSAAKTSSSTNDDDDGHLKQKKNILQDTQLSLGLPAFAKDSHPLKTSLSFVSGAKRGFSFSDALDHLGPPPPPPTKWAFGSEALDLDQQGSALFSPRGGGLESSTSSNSHKPSLILPPTNNPVEHKKTSPAAPAPAPKAQVVGWPPVRSFRKNTMATSLLKDSGGVAEGSNSGSGGCLYVKVSMDGAPFLRKVDLKTYNNYAELSSALEKMFSCFTLGHSHGLPGREGLSESRLKDLLHGSECVLTYEDKDGDWMLVGDVPWEMFTESCKRLRIMKGSEAIGLAPRALEKCKNKN